MSAEHPPELDWMAGFPPPADKLVRFADGSFYSWPQMRWSFNHMEQLVPTKAVWRGPRASREIPKEPQQLDHLLITLDDKSQLAWHEMLETTHTDGLAVLHQGRLVYERYFAATGPHTRHTWRARRSVRLSRAQHFCARMDCAAGCTARHHLAGV